MAYLVSRQPHMPEFYLVFVTGLQIVGEGKTNIFAYYNPETQQYYQVNDRVNGRVHDGSAADPKNFVPFPDMSEMDVVRVLALSAPGANSFVVGVPPAIELPFLRVALFYQPHFPMDARQRELVKPFR
jgi:hypothetical protein